MDFTYKSYEELIGMLRSHGYVIASYRDWQDHKRCAILRHDIDYDPQKALRIAQIEKEEGVRSTFFALLTSDFYNVHSERTYKVLRQICDLGHEIGLHFDEKRYGSKYRGGEFVIDAIAKEAKTMESAIGIKINSVSMHRPSQEILYEDLELPEMINSYSKVFFEEFKYLSDSRRNWREPVEEIIKQEKFERLHILTHPFWYNEKQIDLGESIRGFVRNGNQDRYEILDSNFSDLGTVMGRQEVG